MWLNEVFGEDCNLALGRKLQLSSFGNFFYESIFPSSILFPVFLTPYDEERNDFFFRFIFWYASFARGCRFHGWYSVGRHSQSKGYMKNNWLFFIISTYKPPSVVSSHSRDENDTEAGIYSRDPPLSIPEIQVLIFDSTSPFIHSLRNSSRLCSAMISV